MQVPCTLKNIFPFEISCVAKAEFQPQCQILLRACSFPPRVQILILLTLRMIAMTKPQTLKPGCIKVQSLHLVISGSYSTSSSFFLIFQLSKDTGLGFVLPAAQCRSYGKCLALSAVMLGAWRVISAKASKFSANPVHRTSTSHLE